MNGDQPLPVERGRLCVPSVDVPDGDGEAVAACGGDEPGRFVRVCQHARLGRTRNILSACDVAEFGLHPCIGSVRANRRDERRVLVRGQLRPVRHDGPGPGLERRADQLTVVDVVELNARANASLGGNREESRQEEAARGRPERCL